MAQQPLVGQVRHIIEASRSHTNTLHSVGIFWTSDQPDAQTSTSQHSQQTDNHSLLVFEPAIPAIERPRPMP